MKFAAKLRLAMRTNTVGAIELSQNLLGKISSGRIGDLADSLKSPTVKEKKLLADALNIPFDWLSGKTNKTPIPIAEFCKKLDLLPASYLGEVSDDMIQHIDEILQYKENQ